MLMMFVPWYNSLDFLALQLRFFGVGSAVERKKIKQVIPGYDAWFKVHMHQNF